jgi:hypothetical protein
VCQTAPEKYHCGEGARVLPSVEKRMQFLVRGLFLRGKKINKWDKQFIREGVMQECNV